MSRAFPRARKQRTLHTGLPLFAPKNINSLAANDFDTQDALADRLRWARLLAVRGPIAGDAAPVYVEARSWRIPCFGSHASMITAGHRPRSDPWSLGA